MPISCRPEKGIELWNKMIGYSTVRCPAWTREPMRYSQLMIRSCSVGSTLTVVDREHVIHRHKYANICASGGVNKIVQAALTPQLRSCECPQLYDSKTRVI